MMERTEIYCHYCGNYIQFDLDTSLDGNHVLICPKCGHEHCRVVEKGKITAERWDSRNPQIFYYTKATIEMQVSSTSMYSRTATGTGAFLIQAWQNTAAG